MHARLVAAHGMMDEAFMTWHAAAVGLNVRTFTQELRSKLHAPQVAAHIDRAARCGVSSAPTFFLNGTRYDGPLDFKSLRQAIQSLHLRQ
jgi:protein-disulfide isomerase